MTTQNRPYVLTVKQPWADLIMAGMKDVENRTWPVPSTLPQWYRCEQSGHARRSPDMVARTGALDCDTLDGPFPFRLWIHAGKEFADCGPEPWAALDHNPHDWASGPGDVLRVVVLGSVTVTGCHHADECMFWRHNDPLTRDEQYCSYWAEPDVFHWALADADPLSAPIPMRGRQGLWRLPEGVLEGVSA